MRNADQELQDQELQHHSGVVAGVLLGVLAGGLAGALAMFLLAPRSGKATRTKIQKKGVELRDRTTGMVQDAVGQLRKQGKQIAKGGRHTAEGLLQQGQDVAAEQLHRVSDAALAGRKAIKSL